MSDSSAITAVGLVLTTGMGVEDSSSGDVYDVTVRKRSEIPYQYVERKASELYSKSFNKENSFNFPALISPSEKVYNELEAFLGDFTTKGNLILQLEMWERFLRAQKQQNNDRNS